MPVEEDRRRTAPARRRNIIDALSQEMDPTLQGSAVSRLRDLVESRRGADVRMLVSADIDGVVSAMMLGQVTGWSVCAAVVRSEAYLLHPDFSSLEELVEGEVFGVDNFSLRFSNASNHPVFWGDKKLGRISPKRCQAITGEFDEAVQQAMRSRLILNPSAWAGIQAAVNRDRDHRAGMYRYPLGTAQALLAALECAGLAPRMFDREYLPWLVANCDGGLDSIRKYPFNVPMWWSALAAAVGPASLSEALYQLANTQRPNQFFEVRNQLRVEDPEAAEALTEDWNIKNPVRESIPSVVRWIEGISGWTDPFRSTAGGGGNRQGGVGALGEWRTIRPTTGKLKTSGTPQWQGLSPEEALDRHLQRAARAVYLSFSQYPEGWSLGYMLDS